MISRSDDFAGQFWDTCRFDVKRQVSALKRWSSFCEGRFWDKGLQGSRRDDLKNMVLENTSRHGQRIELHSSIEVKNASAGVSQTTRIPEKCKESPRGFSSQVDCMSSSIDSFFDKPNGVYSFLLLGLRNHVSRLELCRPLGKITLLCGPWL